MLFVITIIFVVDDAVMLPYVDPVESPAQIMKTELVVDTVPYVGSMESQAQVMKTEPVVGAVHDVLEPNVDVVPVVSKMR